MTPPTNPIMVSWNDISVMMIVLNEADRLPLAIRSVPRAGEVIVVDGGSTDGTNLIAERLGCTVYHHSFRSFPEQKQIALQLASRTWVLNLDADERVSSELESEIADRRVDPDVRAYRIPFMNFLWGKWVRSSGWWPDRKTRLVRRDVARIRANGLFVHESLTLSSGRIEDLVHPILHTGYRNLDDVLAKIDRYSTMGAWDLRLKDRKSRWFHRWCLPLWAFFQTFVLRGGFHDPRLGFWVARLNAESTRMKYWKLWELERGLRPPPPDVSRDQEDGGS